MRVSQNKLAVFERLQK